MFARSPQDRTRWMDADGRRWSYRTCRASRNARALGAPNGMATISALFAAPRDRLSAATSPWLARPTRELADRRAWRDTTGIDVRLGPPASIAGTVTVPTERLWRVPGSGLTSSFRIRLRPLPWRTTTDGLGSLHSHRSGGRPVLHQSGHARNPGMGCFTRRQQSRYPSARSLAPNPSGHDIAIPTPGMLQVTLPSGEGLRHGVSRDSWNREGDDWPLPTYLPPGDYRIGLEMSSCIS